MRLEGITKKINWNNLFDAFKEAICFILLITGLFIIFLYLGISGEYEPTSIQNFILLGLGCFGSYAFIMSVFFEESKTRNKKIGKHVLLLAWFFIVLGIIFIILSLLGFLTRLNEENPFVWMSMFIGGMFVMLLLLFTTLFYEKKDQETEIEKESN